MRLARSDWATSLAALNQEDGQPLTNGTMKAPLERAVRGAGIYREQGLSGWHDLRHTYGSHLAMRGVPAI